MKTVIRYAAFSYDSLCLNITCHTDSSISLCHSSPDHPKTFPSSSPLLIQVFLPVAWIIPKTSKIILRATFLSVPIHFIERFQSYVLTQNCSKKSIGGDQLNSLSKELLIKQKTPNQKSVKGITLAAETVKAFIG